MQPTGYREAKSVEEMIEMARHAADMAMDQLDHLYDGSHFHANCFASENVSETAQDYGFPHSSPEWYAITEAFDARWSEIGGTFSE